MAKLPERYMEERRQAILEAATRVFVEKGYDAATINDIASEAGVAAGSIYRYFESKSDLIAAAAGACIESDLAMWDNPAPPGMTPGQTFHALGQTVQKKFNQDDLRANAILRMESYLAASRDPALNERLVALHAQSVDTMARLIRQAQESGELDPSLDSEDLSRLLHAVGAGYGALSVLQGPSSDTARAWQFLVTFVGAYFSPGFTPFKAGEGEDISE